ncbi:MAG: DUF1566 domain-containing protein [Desulfuromonadaceae bacterium]|nr:DUF1566 domain-containing protein [Desulfuromonadaceae bacterium]
MKRVTLLLAGVLMITLWAGTALADDSRFAFSWRTVEDKRTDLTWARDADMGKLDWAGASELINTLNKKEYAGAKDWRLPNKDELGTLITYAMRAGYGGGMELLSPYQFLNKAGFKDVQLCFYWSSSPSDVSASNIWVVNMFDGKGRFENKESSFCVWPVHGGKTDSK